MPLFILTSGIFSGMEVRNETNLKYKRKLFLAILNYFVIYISVWGSVRLFNQDTDFNFLTAQGGSNAWFMMSIVWYLVLMPFLVEVGPLWGVIISVSLSVACKFFYVGGDLLSISRTLSFLPFFAIGLYFGPSIKMSINSAKISTSVKFFAGIVIAMVSWLLIRMPYRRIVFIKWMCKGREDFYTIMKGTGIHYSLSKLIIIEGLYIVLVAVVCIAVMLLVPKKEVPILKEVGAKTFQIYVGHSIIWYMVRSAGYDAVIRAIIPESCFLPASLIASILVTLLFAYLPNFENYLSNLSKIVIKEKRISL